LDNFEWVHCYANALNDEYHYRYGKQHKSVVEVVNALPEPKNLPRKGLTPFGMAMPEDLQDPDDVIGSYRLFYHTDKATFATWSHRDKPYWWNEDEAWYDKRITQ
tara:strand:- start:687 stop:1001 length:315 start_codon:yes stop_codon:yes gene_type:complete